MLTKNDILREVGFSEEYIKELDEYNEKVTELHFDDISYDGSTEIECHDFDNLIIHGDRADSGTDIIIKI